MYMFIVERTYFTQCMYAIHFAFSRYIADKSTTQWELRKSRTLKKSRNYHTWQYFLQE